MEEGVPLEGKDKIKRVDWQNLVAKEGIDIEHQDASSLDVPRRWSR